MICIKLPAPPSANNLFTNIPGKGRVKSARYKTWINAAGWAVKEQHPDPVTGPVKVQITCDRPRGRADIDNKIKPILDLLVIHELIEDDRQVMEVTARWGEVGGAIVAVEAA